MAESVDAMVSNTIVCKDMPVRVRLWVPVIPRKHLFYRRLRGILAFVPKRHRNALKIIFCISSPDGPFVATRRLPVV